MINVLIAEDHLLVCAGIRALLERAEDMVVIGEASNGQQAVDMAAALKPDVLIMDIMMPRLNGIQAAEKIRSQRPPVHILLLSMYSDETLIYQALQSGVRGYLLESSLSDDLLYAVRTIANGETYLSKQVSDILLENALNPGPTGQGMEGIAILSPREKEVLQLIAEEHTSTEIAKILSISEKTVEKHRSSLMEKLNVRNLAGLVRAAVKYRLVDRD